jgi:hypothetical protein
MSVKKIDNNMDENKTPGTNQAACVYWITNNRITF